MVSGTLNSAVEGWSSLSVRESAKLRSSTRKPLVLVSLVALAATLLALFVAAPADAQAATLTQATVVFTNVMKTTARVEIEFANPQGASVTVYARFRTPPDAGSWNAAPSQTTAGNKATFDLSGLTEDTEYQIEFSLDAGFQNVRQVTFYTATDPDPPTLLSLVEGDGSLTITWLLPLSVYFDGLDLGDSALTGFKVRWKSGDQQFSPSREVLKPRDAREHTITGLENGRSYTYAVVAVAPHGETQSTEFMGTPMAIPMVSDVSIDPQTITNVEAVVKVTAVDLPPGTTPIYLRHKQSSDTVFPLPVSQDANPNQLEVTFALTGLTQGVTYDVEASLSENFDAGVASTSFDTDDVPAAPVVSIIPGHERLRVNWTVDDRGSPITVLTIKWTNVNTGVAADLVALNLDATTSLISSLENGVPYRVEVQAENEYGQGVVGEATATPVEGPSIDMVTTLETTQTTAKLRVQLANVDATSRTIRLEYSASGTDDVSVLTSEPSSGAIFDFDLTGLLGNTRYFVRAFIEGPAEIGFGMTFTTTRSAPLAPDVNIEHGDRQLTVNWMAPNAGGFPITRYTVQWKSGNESYSSSRQKTTDATGRSVVIDGLTNGTEYMVQVFANNPQFGNGTPTELKATPSTEPRSAPANPAITACDNSLRLSWLAPVDNGGSPITYYTIQWKSGQEDYDDMAAPPREHVTQSSTQMFTLSSLVNGTTYAFRILATNRDGDAMDAGGNPLWSEDVTGTPREGICISAVGFGNILSQSAPVIIEVADATPGSKVYMRYRQADSDEWSESQIATLSGDATSVTLDATDLIPDTVYEVQASLAQGFDSELTARAFFKTGPAPPSGTVRGGGAFSRILRIEPSITSLTVSEGDTVRLSVDVYGRQGLFDNNLADRAPDEGRPAFTWRAQAGSLSEADIRQQWRNGEADDREVVFTAPATAGQFAVTASLEKAGTCQGAGSDESIEDQQARCSATINVTVRRRSAVGPERRVPVNPQGDIPEVLTDSEGTAYAVFTPEEGGTFTGEGYSLSAGPGAVTNGEFIGISVAPSGAASNAGMTWHRYTLGGSAYAISVVNAAGQRISTYALQEPVSVCLPLPDEIRTKIADVVVAASDDIRGLTVLATTVKLSDTQVLACGAISTLPARVAVGTVGAPEEPIPETPETPETDHEALPGTGGFAPMETLLLLLALAGTAVFTSGAIIAVRRSPA